MAEGIQAPQWTRQPAIRRVCELVVSNPERSGVGVLLFVLFIVAVYRWSQFTGFAAPPGSDGGQWLAFGREMLTNEEVKAGLGRYPPVIPIAVGLLERVVGAMLSLKLVGYVASLLIAAPIFLLVRSRLPWWLAIGVAALPTVAPYHAEVLSFGGYPQLTGTAFMVVTLYLLATGIEARDRRRLLLAGLTMAVTFSTHVLAAAALMIASPVLIGLAQWRVFGRGGVMNAASLRPLLWWVVPGLLLSLPMIPVYAEYFGEIGRSPSSPHDLTYGQLLDFFDSSWRWESIVWLAAAAGAFVVFVRGLRDRDAAYEVAVALSVVAGLGILVLLELRALEVLEIAIILWLSVAVAGSYRYWRERPELKRTAALGLVLGVMLLIALVGHRRTVIARDWYRVLDHQVVSGMDWLRTNGDRSGRVVSSPALRGHNFGWWIEGYSRIPAFTATEEYLIFHEERRQGLVADTIISPGATPAEIATLAATENIRYVFLDRDVVSPPYTQLALAGFETAFENDRVIVLESAGR